MDGLGMKGAFMFEYVEDKEYLSRVRSVCGEIMQDFCHTLKEDYDIGSTFRLVGSGAKNLIVQNASQPIDFNQALYMNGWGDCKDSTSSLTTERRHFTQGNQTLFSIDVCIVVTDAQDRMYRLIHEKRGFIDYDRYYWNQAPYSSGIREKVDFIKRKGKWNLVRKQYLRLKNKYLTSNDYNHPSFICYIEAVNNVYNSRMSWK